MQAASALDVQAAPAPSNVYSTPEEFRKLFTAKGARAWRRVSGPAASSLDALCTGYTQRTTPGPCAPLLHRGLPWKEQAKRGLLHAFPGWDRAWIDVVVRSQTRTERKSTVEECGRMVRLCCRLKAEYHGLHVFRDLQGAACLLTGRIPRLRRLRGADCLLTGRS